MKQHRDYHYTGYMIYKKAKEYIPLQTAMFLGMFAVTQIDSLVVSRLLGVQVLAALNTYSCIQLLTTALISMIETGVTVVYATAIGQNDSEQLNAVKCASTVLLLGLSGVLAVIQLPLAYAATVPLGLTAETRQLFLMYTVSMFFQVILNGWVIIWSAQIRAVGRMKLAALVSVLSGVLNVAFDYLFISAFNMGIRGAGYSSTVSALVCFAVLLVFMRKKTDLLRIRFCRCGGIIKEILKCGSSSMLSLLVTMVFNYALIWGVNRALGDSGLAAKAVCAFVYRLALCFSKPLASLVAQFTGVYYAADNKKGVYMLSQRLTYMCLMVTGVICIYLWLAPQSVFRLFGYTAITASDVAVLRLFTVSILFDLPLSVLENYFMGTKQVGFLNFLEVAGAVLKAAALLVTVYLIGGVSVIAVYFVPSVLNACLMVPRYFAHRRKYRKYLANENVHNLGFTFSGNRAEALPEALHRFYLDNGLDTRLAYHITLVLEEFLTLVVRKNQGANVNIEVCIVIRHGRANILSWDDGVVTSIDTEALVREQLSEEKMILLISDSVKSSRVFDLNYYTFSIIDTSEEKST